MSLPEIWPPDGPQSRILRAIVGGYEAALRGQLHNPWPVDSPEASIWDNARREALDFELGGDLPPGYFAYMADEEIH